MVIRNKSKARRNDPMKTLASHKEKYYVAGRSYNVKQTKEMKHLTLISTYFTKA